MFIPPGGVRLPKRKTDVTEEQPVYLRSEHLILHPSLVKRVFGEEYSVAVVYYPDRRTLMIAPISNELFLSLHKAQQYMLKQTARDREYAIALHTILYDHDIDTTERYLPYEANEQLQILTVTL